MLFTTDENYGIIFKRGELMKILVTGGAGFIGCNFIHYLTEKYPSYDIICVDCLTYASNINALSDVMKNENFRFYKADICDRVAVFDIFESEKPDIVVNLAAESHVDRSIDCADIFLKTNFVGTGVLLDASLKHRVERFHQISTDEVYGDLPLDKKELSFDEHSPLRPSSPYSASKASADLLVLSYFRTHSLPVTVSRCSNNYGPYQHNEKLIPFMISRALSSESLTLYGDGKNVRDWIHVTDHCKAIDLIIHKGKAGEIYNVGASCEISNIDIVKMILKELDKDESLITYVKDRPGHDLRYAINSKKLITTLGWQPSVDFKIGLKNTLDWYKNLYS